MDTGLDRLSRETAQRYQAVASTHVAQMEAMTRHLRGVRGKLLVLKSRLEREIMNGEAGEEAYPAYQNCCMRIGRISQALGNLEELAGAGRIHSTDRAKARS